MTAAPSAVWREDGHPTYPVNEIFSTIQGEGVHAGRAATFIRLQGCPVGCPFCDTKNTWHLDPRPEPKNSTREVQLDELDALGREAWTEATPEEITLYAHSGWSPLAVITGGEPCLYDLRPLIARIEGTGARVQVETSGTQAPRVSVDTWLTLAPKIAMPGGFDVLGAAWERANEIKYPIASQRDADRFRTLLAAPPWRDSAQLSVSPVSSRPHAVELCRALVREFFAVRLSVQVHALVGLR